MADDHWMLDPVAAEQPPTPTARRIGVLLTAAVAVVAAVTVPGLRLGLQIPVLAAGAALAVHLTRRRRLAASDLLLVGLGLALAAMAALRAAAWIVLIDLIASAGLAAAVATRATRWSEIFAAPFVVLGQVPSVPAFLRGPRGERAARGPALRPAMRGATIGLALLAVFGGLFVSADRAFAQLATRFLVPDIDLSLVPARAIVFVAAGLAIGALARAGRVSVSASEPRSALRPVEWTIALTALDVLFVSFVAVQIAVLFGGRAHVLDTAGLTYAEYARQGFFQLLAVGALTLGVVAAAVRWARPGSHTRTLKVLLGILCVCTLVVLASAFRRLGLYESVFGSTRLRLSVHATILWMAALFLLVLVAGIHMRAPWLPRATIVLTAIALVAFTLANPDRLIAERNVRRFQTTGHLDLDYVRSLSADAVPALAKLPPGVRCWAVRPVAAGLPPGEPLLGWNLGRANARAALEGRVGAAAPACDVDALAPFLPGRSGSGA